MKKDDPNFLDLEDEKEELNAEQAPVSSSASKPDKAKRKTKREKGPTRKSSLAKLPLIVGGGVVMLGVALFVVWNTMVTPKESPYEPIATDFVPIPSESNPMSSDNASEMARADRPEDNDLGQLPSHDTSKQLALLVDAIEAQDVSSRDLSQRVTTLGENQRQLFLQLDGLSENSSQDSGGSSGINSKEKEQLLSAIRKLQQSQDAINGRLSAIESNAKASVNRVAEMASRAQAEVAGLNEVVKQLREGDVGASNRPRVQGKDIELMTVTTGYAFLRMTDDQEKQFTLQVGEPLRGYGKVERITALGCIHAGGEKIEPLGGVCQL